MGIPEEKDYQNFHPISWGEFLAIADSTCRDRKVVGVIKDFFDESTTNVKICRIGKRVFFACFYKSWFRNQACVSISLFDPDLDVHLYDRRWAADSPDNFLKWMKDLL